MESPDGEESYTRTVGRPSRGSRTQQCSTLSAPKSTIFLTFRDTTNRCRTGSYLRSVAPLSGESWHQERGPGAHALEPPSPARSPVLASGCSLALAFYAVNELPQPQPPEAFGFLNVKPEPIMVVT